jgi:hypothetical protein
VYRVYLGVLFTPPFLSNAQGFLTLLGDIDGDGKVDYMTISDDDGSITAWRNGGVGVPTFWQALGVVFNEGGGLEWSQFRFVCTSSVYTSPIVVWKISANRLQADINGDGNKISVTKAP